MTGMPGLINELDAVLGAASVPRRTAILQQVTDLFLEGAASYSDEQVAVFDVVMNLLVQKIERPALIELSKRLASANRAPADTIGRLASDDDLMISEAILVHCNAITDETIVEIAKAKGQGHLLAIASRKELTEAITDVLISRADPKVMRNVLSNRGAQISQVGFVKLINEAKRDSKLTELLSSRSDVPSELQPFLELLRA